MEYTSNTLSFKTTESPGHSGRYAELSAAMSDARSRQQNKVVSTIVPRSASGYAGYGCEPVEDWLID